MPNRTRAFVWKEPWVPCGADNAVDLARELARELSPGHPLFGLTATAIGRREDRNDVLFHLAEEEHPYAVVHLSWSGRPELDPRWPHTTCFSSLDDWVARRLDPDAAEYWGEISRQS